MKLRYLAILFAVFLQMGCLPQPAIAPMERLQTRTSEAVISYQFNANTNILSAHQQQKMRGFLADKAPRQSDWLIVSIPKAANSKGDQIRQAAVKKVFYNFPGRIELISAQGFSPAVPPQNQGVVKLFRAERPAVLCPEQTSAVGCASAYNIAAMLSDPMDLRLSSTHTHYRPVAAAAALSVSP